MADNNIDLTATFDVSSATKSVGEFGKSATKSIDGVNKSVSTFASSIDKTSKTKLDLDTSRISSSLEGLRGKILAVGAGIAAYFTVGAVKNFFDAAITGAMGQETALNQLNGALSRTGELTQQRTDDMTKFASSLQSVSTIGDEVALGQLSVARNFTKTDEQARKLVLAAAEMSAALGISLETAVDQLGKTMDGTAGRLNETVPALRGLSQEALKSGAAIELVAKQFAGAATNEIKTFEGALIQLKNSYGDVFESFGLAITQSPIVIAAMNELSKAFGNLASNLDNTRDASISLVDRGLMTIISGIRDLLPSLSTITSIMKVLLVLFETLLKSALNLVDGLKIVGNSWLWLVGTVSGKKNSLNDMSDAFERIKKRSDDLADSWSELGKTGFKKIDTSEFDAALKRIQEAAKKPIEINTQVVPPKQGDAKINWEDYVNTKIDDIKVEPIKPEIKPEDVGFTPEQLKNMGFEQWFTDLSEFLDKFILEFNAPNDNPITLDWNEYVGLPKENSLTTFFKSAVDGVKAAASYIWNVVPPIKGITYLISKGFFGVYQTLKNSGPQILDGISSLISAMGQGAEGAKTAIPQVLADLMKGVGGAVGAIWGPMGSAIGTGIGGIIGEQIKLASGPIGETMTKIEGFFDEVPNVIDRITENLPTIMNKIFEKLPNLLMVIFKALPAIMRASASAMKPLFQALGKESNSLAQVALEVVWESIAMVFMAIGYAFQGLLIGLQEEWKEKLNAAWDKVTEAITSIFDGTFLQDIKDAFINGFGGLFDGTFEKNIKDIFKNGFGGLFDGTFLQNIRDTVKGAFGGLFDGTFEKNIKDVFINGFGGLFDGTFEKNIKKAFTDGFGGLFDGTFEKNIKDVFIGAFGGLFTDKFWKDVGQAIIDGFKDIFKNLNPAEIVQGGGKGGKTGAEVVVNVLSGGLAATGGVVPKGYPDDKYPALLTSNEVVIPVQTAGNLFSLIDSLASGNNNTAGNNETNQLLKQLITIIANQQTQIDVKLDRDTLARAILSLNKDNRRLA